MSSDGDAIALRAHGGIVEDEIAALGLVGDARDLLDFSVNVNPYGPTPAMLDAIRSAPVDRYPDPTSRAARRAIAKLIGASPDAVVVGNGAVELMWTLARALLRAGDAVVVVEPTFSELRAAATLAGARIFEHRAREEAGFAIDLDALAVTARRARAKLVYLCSPGNPTGTLTPIASIAAFAASLDDTWIVLDQSFLSLSDGHADRAHALPPNVIAVRSLTKDHAIPGLRAGYLATTEALARRIEAARPPWTTSAPAQAAIVAATREEAFVATSRAQLLENRARLTERLQSAGFGVHASSTVYVLVRVRDAHGLRGGLLTRERILVRDCASFGLPHFIRVCARPRADEDRLIAALARTQELLE